MRNLFTQIKQSVTFLLLTILIAFTGAANAELYGASGAIVTKTNGAGLTNPVINSSSIEAPAFGTQAACDAHLAALHNAVPVTDANGDGSAFPTVRFYILGKCSPLGRNQ